MFKSKVVKGLVLDLFESNSIVCKGIGVGICLKVIVQFVREWVLDLFESNSIVCKGIGVGSV